MYDKTRTSVRDPGAHNVQLSFGRIEPRATKERTRAIPAPTTAASTSPMAVAEVTALNAAVVTFHQRLQLAVSAPPAPAVVDVTCASPANAVAAGQSALLECELGNSGTTPATELAYAATSGSAAIPVKGPAELAPGKRAQLAVVVPIPRTAPPGGKIAVTVTVRDRAKAWTSKEAFVTVAIGACTRGKLTRAKYEESHKQLEDARKRGSLTQDEFDKYEAELIACLP